MLYVELCVTDFLIAQFTQLTSCGARHNKPRPLLPPSEWYWLVNASPLSYGRW